MKNYQINMAGGMGKFGKDNFDEGNRWRLIFKKRLESCEHMNVKAINPNDYFSFKQDPPRYISLREIMEFDLNRVRNADLIIVNFNDMYSLGTMAEIAIAYERKIPIIVFNETNQKLHPWEVEMCNRIFTETHELLDYVEYFYLTEYRW